LRYGEGSREDFEAHYALVESAGQLETEAVFVAFALQFSGNAPRNLEKIGSGAAAGVENDDIGIGEAARPTKLRSQQVIYPLDLIADNFRRRVPDTEVFP
jgi:hypothetical protein